MGVKALVSEKIPVKIPVEREFLLEQTGLAGLRAPPVCT
jgi:hypothetical protein